VLPLAPPVAPMLAWLERPHGPGDDEEGVCGRTGYVPSVTEPNDVFTAGVGQPYVDSAVATAFLPERTALLVIDPVNDFLSEGGADWDMTRSTVEKHDVVGHLRQALAGARRHGVPVVFGPMAFTAEDYANTQLQRRSGINRIMFERRMFLAGSWGAAFHPHLQPQEGDVVLLPHKGVDVFQTDLPQHLERLGTTHLVIAGMTANLCCESTGRHAMERGYDVTFLRDAIGADTVAAYEAAVRLSYPLIGNGVLTVAELLNGLADGPRLPRTGDAVVGSDRVRIGRDQGRCAAPRRRTRARRGAAPTQVVAGRLHPTGRDRAGASPASGRERSRAVPRQNALAAAAAQVRPRSKIQGPGVRG
jgi:ureidoacrylate peracid hydrolase